jgi:hypothetical protein
VTAEFYISLQYTAASPQLVPPSVWTTLWFDTVLDQPSSDWLAGVAAPGPWSLVRPPSAVGSRKGTHASGYAHWGLVDGLGLAELGASKMGLRLCRNPDGVAPNTTCTDMRALSGGKEYHAGWGHQLTAKITDAWALQVWHDALVAVPLVAAEFKVTVP